MLVVSQKCLSCWSYSTFTMFTVRKFTSDQRVKQLGREQCRRKQLRVLLQPLTAKGTKNFKVQKPSEIMKEPDAKKNVFCSFNEVFTLIGDSEFTKSVKRNTFH